MTVKTRFVRVAGLALWLGLAFWTLSRCAGETQQQVQDDPRFTGATSTLEATGLNLARRRFEAGARSAWHFHDNGQLLFVEEGRARIQKRGQPLLEMGVGESDYTGPKIEHWHGATPHEHYVQVAVGFGTGATWLEKTTEEEYNGTSR